MLASDPICADIIQDGAQFVECRLHRTLMESAGVLLSPDERYRYVLWRLWERHRGACTFVMLNPSVADEKLPDPTVTKCVGFARRWGFGAVIVVNLFALRSTLPEVLKKAQDPTGPHNAHFVKRVLDSRWTKRLVLAWGNEGALHARDEAFMVVNEQREMYCLQPPNKSALTRLGAPRHPSRIDYSSRLVRVHWEGSLVVSEHDNPKQEASS